MTMVITHIAYLVISASVTVLVARTLKEHGAVFMTGDDADPTPLIKAKSHLLNVGFYLINFGVIALALRFGGDATNTKTAIEIVSSKLGTIILAIGFMHFAMMAILAGERHNNRGTIIASQVPVAEAH
ncbi:MAG: hypothetical protein KDB27_33795 [Planctomycetales bacterium]|nr:hypothetical protein [Planctomycetales bacterium]